jgi:hypothetical protein
MDEKMELLKTTSDYIVNLKSEILKASECFRSGEDTDGFNLVPSIAEGLGWIINALKITGDLLKQHISIDKLNEKLNEIVEAIENQDTMLIGDLFEYELFPMIESIEKDVNSVVLN